MGLPQAQAGAPSPLAEGESTVKVYMPKFSLSDWLWHWGQRVSPLRDQEVSTSNWWPHDWHEKA